MCLMMRDAQCNTCELCWKTLKQPAACLTSSCAILGITHRRLCTLRYCAAASLIPQLLIVALCCTYG
jgi:hypothetical protein